MLVTEISGQLLSSIALEDHDWLDPSDVIRRYGRPVGGSSPLDLSKVHFHQQLGLTLVFVDLLVYLSQLGVDELLCVSR